jgi:glycosyltransferase involved in cell wall biosynthesis
MSKTVFVSICIPAYKRTEFLKRLLNSIAFQTYKDFEVIITDDSNDNSVEVLVDSYKGLFQLNYEKNFPALGSPENWNAGIRKAKGNWIKIMHDDDWFSSEESLQKFINAINNNSQVSFFFSAYNNVLERTNEQTSINLSAINKFYLSNAYRLLAHNVIGPPSVTLYQKKDVFFDKELKWLVDIDFYIQYLKDEQIFYIPEPLTFIGINSEQVTQSSFRNKKIEIPENFHVLNKIGLEQLKDVVVYDAWWRLLRNLNIESVEDINEAGYNKEIPAVIKKMIQHQRKLSTGILKRGITSKTFMLLSYFINKKHLSQK